jgi:hypothetical protein
MEIEIRTRPRCPACRAEKVAQPLDRRQAGRKSKSVVTTVTDLLLQRTGSTGDQYEVIAEDQVVGYIRLSSAARTATPWMWTLAYGQHEDRTRAHGYEATRDAAMQEFARSWRRE